MGTGIPGVWSVIVAVLLVHGPYAGASGSDRAAPTAGSMEAVSAVESPAPAIEAGSDTAVAERGRRNDPDGVRQAQDPADILRATSARYEALWAIQARFEQELQNTLLGRTTRSAGMLYQRYPDRFLMDFSDPEGDLIVSDGQSFWMFFPSVDAKQVVRVPRRNQGLDLQAQFIGDVVERFDVTYHGMEEVRGRPAHVMTLDPREPLGYQRLKVWIDEKDHLVRRFELTEETGNVRHMELMDVLVNPTLPDTMFRFTPPPDAIVVDRG